MKSLAIPFLGVLTFSYRLIFSIFDLIWSHYINGTIRIRVHAEYVSEANERCEHSYLWEYCLHVKLCVTQMNYCSIAVVLVPLSNSFVTPWTVACQAPLTMGFSRQEYWSGLSFPSPGDLPNPGIGPMSLELQADSIPLSHLGSPPKYNNPKNLRMYLLRNSFTWR